MNFRSALCVRHESGIYRLVWLNESSAGIYIGVLGSDEDSHMSYHSDGTRHTKIGSDYHGGVSDTPIADHTGIRHLGHFSLSLTKNWFNSKTIYSGDEKTASIMLIDESLLTGKDTLAMDVWITDRASEQNLLTTTGNSRFDKFTPVSEFLSALEYFPDQKIAISLHSARVRDVDSSELMFPDKAMRCEAV